MDDDELLCFLNDTNNEQRDETNGIMVKENYPMECVPSKTNIEYRNKRSKVNTLAIFPVKDGSVLSICHLDSDINPEYFFSFSLNKSKINFPLSHFDVLYKLYPHIQGILFETILHK